MKEAERLICEYHANCSLLEIARARLRELKSISAQNYEVMNHGVASSPVEAAFEHAEAVNARIARLEQKVQPVYIFLYAMRSGGSLDRETAAVIEARCWKHETWGEISRKLHISPRTALKRKKRGLKMLALYIHGNEKTGAD